MSSGITSHLSVAESPTGAGRGVFARRLIAAGEEIERCPMLIVDGDQAEALSLGADGYVFGWGNDSTALALGYGSLYNHSYAPNAETLETPNELVITALRSISEGEEIFINYMGTAQEGVWFDLL
jgi:SET domain-containing protein